MISVTPPNDHSGPGGPDRAVPKGNFTGAPIEVSGRVKASLTAASTPGDRIRNLCNSVHGAPLNGETIKHSAAAGANEFATEVKLATTPDSCDGCDGSGIHVHDPAPTNRPLGNGGRVPDGYVIIERCDTCAIHDGDLAAARAYAGERADFDVIDREKDTICRRRSSLANNLRGVGLRLATDIAPTNSDGFIPLATTAGGMVAAANTGKDARSFKGLTLAVEYGKPVTLRTIDGVLGTITVVKNGAKARICFDLPESIAINRDGYTPPVSAEQAALLTPFDRAAFRVKCGGCSATLTHKPAHNADRGHDIAAHPGGFVCRCGWELLDAPRDESHRPFGRPTPAPLVKLGQGDSATNYTPGTPNTR